MITALKSGNKYMRLFEYDKAYFNENPLLSSKRTLKAIKEFNLGYAKKNTLADESRDEDTGVFTLYKDYLKCTNYVGVGYFGDVRIEVLPKIYKTEDDADEYRHRDARLALLNMLNLIYDINLKISPATIEVGNLLRKDIHQIFLYLYAKTLLENVQQGFHREYIDVKGDEKFLRGKLIVYEQAKKLPHELHTFNIQYSLLIEDNLLNRIFKFVTHLGLNFVEEPRIRNLFLTLKTLFSNIKYDI